MREAQEIEGGRFPVPPPAAVPDGEAPELQQASLVRVSRQVERRQSCAQFLLKRPRFGPLLEAQHAVLGVPHDAHIPVCVALPPSARPEVTRIMERDVRQHGAGYTSYKVAKNVVEFSTSIPREPLHSSSGAGFLGAPLTRVKPDDIPRERERGGRHGTSRTEHDQGAGGQRPV